MKMKTSILTALIALAGSATLMAQTNVYSLNAVGYVNTTIPSGYSIICNPLVASGVTASNTLSKLFPSTIPQGTVVYKFEGGNFQIATYAADDFGNVSWDFDLSVMPGEGFWVFNPSAAYTNTFVGEVAQGSGATTNNIPTGFSLKSSVIPQAGQLDSVLGYVPNQGDVIYFFRSGNFAISTYGPDDFGNVSWDFPPVPGVGEGFWVFNPNAPKNWVRTFSTSN
jgi:hypothetical protein